MTTCYFLRDDDPPNELLDDEPPNDENVVLDGDEDPPKGDEEGLYVCAGRDEGPPNGCLLPLVVDGRTGDGAEVARPLFITIVWLWTFVTNVLRG